MDFYKFIGVLAMILVQGSTLFQIVKFINKKTTKGVSIGFWWVIFAGLSCYLVYSIHIRDWLYITSNSVGMVLSAISIALYYIYFWKENGLPDAKDVQVCKCQYLDNIPGCNCED